MRIAVVGAGGIGGYVGARLIQAGGDVSFIARGAHLEAMLRDGLRIRSIAGDLLLSDVSASAEPADIGQVDLVIFAVKLYDTEKAAASLGPLIGGSTLILTLQNGVDSVETLRRHAPRATVAGGATYISGFIGQPGEIVHVGGLPHILVGDEPAAFVQKFEALCRMAIGLELHLTADIESVLWEKFVTLAAFSGGTSLMRSGIGPILEDVEAKIFIEQLRDEGIALAAAAGHPLSDGFADRVMVRWAALPWNGKSSMANDLERGKPLEVEWLSGRMHRLGLQFGIATPGHTSVLRALHLYAKGTAR